MMLYLYCQLTSALASRHAAAPTLARRQPVRGATFIEYAILAAIAVAIGIIFREQLGAAFNQVFNRVRDALNMT